MPKSTKRTFRYGRTDRSTITIKKLLSLKLSIFKTLQDTELIKGIQPRISHQEAAYCKTL